MALHRSTLELNRANFVTFLVPIFELMAGATFFGDKLEAVQIVGVVLVTANIRPTPQLACLG